MNKTSLESFRDHVEIATGALREVQTDLLEPDALSEDARKADVQCEWCIGAG